MQRMHYRCRRPKLSSCGCRHLYRRWPLVTANDWAILIEKES